MRIMIKNKDGLVVRTDKAFIFQIIRHEYIFFTLGGTVDKMQKVCFGMLKDNEIHPILESDLLFVQAFLIKLANNELDSDIKPIMYDNLDLLIVGGQKTMLPIEQVLKYGVDINDEEIVDDFIFEPNDISKLNDNKVENNNSINNEKINISDKASELINFDNDFDKTIQIPDLKHLINKENHLINNKLDNEDNTIETKKIDEQNVTKENKEDKEDKVSKFAIAIIVMLIVVGLVMLYIFLNQKTNNNNKVVGESQKKEVLQTLNCEKNPNNVIKNEKSSTIIISYKNSVFSKAHITEIIVFDNEKEFKDYSKDVKTKTNYAGYSEKVSTSEDKLTYMHIYELEKPSVDDSLIKEKIGDGATIEEVENEHEQNGFTCKIS